jgi:peptide deformylase
MILFLAIVAHIFGGNVEYQDPKKLTIVQIGDPILRKRARALLHKEILSPEIQDFIEAMKETMREAPGVGLAAPQVGESLQIVVIEDRREYHSYLTPQQLAERERIPISLHVIINPRLYIEEEEKAVFFEGCLSVPEFMGVVPRAKVVRVECLNEHAEPVTLEARGWYARILQHEIDHLNGVLYIDRAITSTLTNMENYDRLWRGKPIAEVFQMFSQEVLN